MINICNSTLPKSCAFNHHRSFEEFTQLKSKRRDHHCNILVNYPSVGGCADGDGGARDGGDVRGRGDGRHSFRPRKL
jgi:hypothetical protein